MTNALLSILSAVSLTAAKIPDDERDQDFYRCFPSAVISFFQSICKTTALGVMHLALSVSWSLVCACATQPTIPVSQEMQKAGKTHKRYTLAHTQVVLK